jgi:hypothetical protein
VKVGKQSVRQFVVKPISAVARESIDRKRRDGQSHDEKKKKGATKQKARPQ